MRVSLGLAIVLSVVSLANAQPRAPDPDDAEVQEISPDEPDEPDPDPVHPPKPTPGPTPGPTPTAPPTEPVAGAPVRTMDELTVPKTYLRFGINFFGDTSFSVSPDSPHTSFSLGALGIRFLGELSPSLDALAEFAFESVDGEGAVSDVEQLAVRWRRGPGMLEVGRFHTEIGYWNTAYHHGLWLQTPIERPHAVRFEDDGGIIPAHWVGAHYAVKTDAGPGRLTLVLGVGNGRGAIVDDVRVLGDTNDMKSVLAKLKYKAGAIEVGISAIYDQIAPAAVAVRPALPDQRIHEIVGNAYIALRGDGPIVIGEGYAFRHLAGNQSWMTYAGFGVLGYAVSPWLTPYLEVDAIHGANDDPFFTPDPLMATPIDFVELLAGARFETSTWSAIKLEVRRTAMTGGSTDYAGIANWSFGL